MGSMPGTGPYLKKKSLTADGEDRYIVIKYFCSLSSDNQQLTQMRAHRAEGNVLFNDALNTFYLLLNGVGHMVKDHSDSERGNTTTWATLFD